MVVHGAPNNIEIPVFGGPMNYRAVPEAPSSIYRKARYVRTNRCYYSNTEIYEWDGK